MRLSEPAGPDAQTDTQTESGPPADVHRLGAYGSDHIGEHAEVFPVAGQPQACIHGTELNQLLSGIVDVGTEAEVDGGAETEVIAALVQERRTGRGRHLALATTTNANVGAPLPGTGVERPDEAGGEHLFDALVVPVAIIARLEQDEPTAEQATAKAVPARLHHRHRERIERDRRRNRRCLLVLAVVGVVDHLDARRVDVLDRVDDTGDGVDLDLGARLALGTVIVDRDDAGLHHHIGGRIFVALGCDFLRHHADEADAGKGQQTILLPLHVRNLLDEHGEFSFFQKLVA